MGNTKNILSHSNEWSLTRWGRIEQGIRELAVALGRDIDAQEFARMLELDPSSLTGWRKGSRPSQANMEKMVGLFHKAGLTRYTAQFIDYGDESARETVERKPYPLRVAESKPEKAAKRRRPSA